MTLASHDIQGEIKELTKVIRQSTPGIATPSPTPVSSDPGSGHIRNVKPSMPLNKRVKEWKIHNCLRLRQFIAILSCPMCTLPLAFTLCLGGQSQTLNIYIMHLKKIHDVRRNLVSEVYWNIQTGVNIILSTKKKYIS